MRVGCDSRGRVGERRPSDDDDESGLIDDHLPLGLPLGLLKGSRLQRITRSTTKAATTATPNSLWLLLQRMKRQECRDEE